MCAANYNSGVKSLIPKNATSWGKDQFRDLKALRRFLKYLLWAHMSDHHKQNVNTVQKEMLYFAYFRLLITGT